MGSLENRRLTPCLSLVPSTPSSTSAALPRCIADHHQLRLEPQIYHPNLDLEGNVCLNILREDWKPVLNLNAVMVGLQYLFLEPNADDPLNKGGSAFFLTRSCDPAHPAAVARIFGHASLTRRSVSYVATTDAANDLRQNRERFQQNVTKSMRGGVVGSEQFDDVRK